MIVLSVIGKILLILLKIIGWTLLGVLGLVLLVLLVVLFLPIRYEADADAGNASGSFAAAAHVKVHLLLRLIQADVAFQDKKLTGVLRIAWKKKQLLGGEPKEDAEPVPEENKPEQDIAIDLSDDGLAEELSDVNPAAETVVKPAEEPKPEPMPEPSKEEEKPQATVEETPEEEAEEEIQEEPKPVPQPDPEELVILYGDEGKEFRMDWSNTFFQTAEDKLKGLYAKYEGTSEKIQGLITKLQELLYKVESLYYEFWYYPDRPYILHLLVRQLMKMLRRIRPTRLNLACRYGLSSPVTTGKIAAAYGIISTMSGEIRHYQVDMTPDFEQKVLEGSFYCKGRLQGYMIVFPVLRIAVSRRVWRLIGYIRKRSKK